jgi:mRNA interferase MazF
MAITGQLRPGTDPVGASIGRWQEAGLLKPSAIKPLFATLEQQLVIRTLGSLASEDEAVLRVAISKIIG